MRGPNPHSFDIMNNIIQKRFGEEAPETPTAEVHSGLHSDTTSDSLEPDSFSTNAQYYHLKEIELSKSLPLRQDSYS